MEVVSCRDQVVTRKEVEDRKDRWTKFVDRSINPAPSNMLSFHSSTGNNRGHLPPSPTPPLMPCAAMAKFFTA
ncbi:hypothetical protein SLEP1_g34263 [Rubroshorea leprosula]|uniref:Uncharacterized protein n=1 Tax=Rubroshorea leprosula TaxID=152421 RepID=A0AAV5KJC7_9ROSI|nr:hypothetical protein SLEP1_g34263 [Rubroshorea leprosula]